MRFEVIVIEWCLLLQQHIHYGQSTCQFLLACSNTTLSIPVVSHKMEAYIVKNRGHWLHENQETAELIPVRASAM
jgi:nucleoside recognition membrane protein YjiH